MNRLTLLLAALLLPFCCAAEDPGAWTIYIANNNCPDYTWGLDEAHVRSAVAELVRAHLDEMTRTDTLDAASRNRYNTATTLEVLLFLERYPDRKAELVRRVKEGRLMVSPFLNNSLWGFQSAESAIRTLYPARRLEKEWGARFDTAFHIEEPSMPWGTASILAGAGVRWLAVPYLDFDSTFKNLENPPLFQWEGPDGGRVRVWLDRWASARQGYWQGKAVLVDARSIAPSFVPDDQRAGYAADHTGGAALEKTWVEHYRELGAPYPLHANLASGTHGDLAVESAGQAREFAGAIARHNEVAKGPRLVNAAFPQFFALADQEHARKPFLPVVRGDFGHSWEVWPVSLARYAGAMRTGGNALLAAESLIAVASLGKPDVAPATQTDRQRAEWNWTMLADHAWNGTDPGNQRENARLRRDWSRELQSLADSLTVRGWEAVGLRPSESEIALFNPASPNRADLVRVESSQKAGWARAGNERSPVQAVKEDGKDALYFVSPVVPGFALRTVKLEPGAPRTTRLRGGPLELDGPWYRVRVDPATGGLASVVHKPTGRELLQNPHRYTIGQTVYFDGVEHLLERVKTELVACGPVLARLKISGEIGATVATTYVTIYDRLDRIDFDMRVSKVPADAQERLTHMFPVGGPGVVERLDTTGAVVRPQRKPQGDLLPGADPTRFAVQEFAEFASPRGGGVTVAPIEAFALRRDLGEIGFEALGNDQDYKEVAHDQAGETEFRFRYSMRLHAGSQLAGVAAWARGVQAPLLATAGGLPARTLRRGPAVAVDPARALAMCLKPAEDRGLILRVRETAGVTRALRVPVAARRAAETDLVERDRKETAVSDGAVTLNLKAHSMATVRLLE